MRLNGVNVACAVQVCESSCNARIMPGGAREVSINSTPWNCDYDELLRWAFQIAHSAFKIEHKHTQKAYPVRVTKVVHTSTCQSASRASYLPILSPFSQAKFIVYNCIASIVFLACTYMYVMYVSTHCVSGQIGYPNSLFRTVYQKKFTFKFGKSFETNVGQYYIRTNLHDSYCYMMHIFR